MATSQKVLTPDDYATIGALLDEELKSYNFEVAKDFKKGKPGKVNKSMKEYRLQLINKTNDTSAKLIPKLKGIIEDNFPWATNIKFNEVSPNSGKYSSVSFDFEGDVIDLVVAKGANSGEKFEINTVKNLAAAFSIVNKDKDTIRVSEDDYIKLIRQLDEAHPDFKNVDVKEVKQRTGSTKKEGVPIANLGAIIGDIVLTDSTDNDWFISLKDVNGDTFSSYSGAASIFDAKGTLQPSSAGSDFLKAFGVDLNQVQKGFDERNNIKTIRPKLAIPRANPAEIKKIFERAWGMNYFYVRKQRDGWKVFWLDRDYLNKLTSGIKVEDIKYPNPKSKQITIMCGNSYQKYTIELRNSKGGEYPNDTKFKVR